MFGWLLMTVRVARNAWSHRPRPSSAFTNHRRVLPRQRRAASRNGRELECARWPRARARMEEARGVLCCPSALALRHHNSRQLWGVGMEEG